MVGIYTYANGLVFTGYVAETKEQAQEYIDKIRSGKCKSDSHYDFRFRKLEIMPIYKIQGDE